MKPAVCEAILTRDFSPEGAVELDRDEVANYLAVLVRLAGMDGLDTGEKDFVLRAAACLGVHAEMAEIAGQFVANPSITTESLIKRIADRGLRLCLLRDAYRLAAADGRFSDTEIGELAGISRALGIANATATEVKAIALQESRLHREFAGLVRSARV
jgi:hypothetical protein